MVLLDLNLHYGNVSVSLDLAPGRGLREILTTPDRIDSLLIASAATKAREGLQILDTEEPLDDVLELGEAGLAALLYDVGSMVDYIIVDTPRDLNVLSRHALDVADVIAIVTDQSLSGMRDTQRILRMIRNRRSDAKCLVIGNRAGGVAGEVGRGDFERGVGAKISVSVPFDMKAAVAAARLGKPLAEVAKSPATIAELQALTLAVCVTPPPTTAPSFLSRILKK